MSPRIALVAAVAATVLSLAAPALASAASAVTSPADGSAYAYGETAPPEITVSGTASGPVDLRCAFKFGSSWSFGTLLTGGDDVPVTGGTFTAGPVVLPADDAGLCRLVAVPHGTTPTDLTGISGPNLRLLIVHNTGGQTDSHGGANQGAPFNHFTTAGGTIADTGYTAAGNTGIDSMSLLSNDPGELGRVFNNADSIPELDPTGPRPSSSAGEVGPLTGILVDGVNAFTGPTWESAITPSLSLVFRNYQPFPSVGVTINPVLGPGDQFVEVENDAIVACRGSDPMWYLPQGATCTGLVDSGVRLTVSTFVSPAGNAVIRIWRLASTDGRAHDVKLWIAHAAATNGVLSRAWKLPGDAGYATRSGSDVPATTGAAPWIARFNSVGAADGDASQGVGAVAASALPSALRFASARELDAKYPLAVPAVGDAELRFVYVGAATQATLESDLAAALPTVNGGGGSGGGSGGSGSGNSGDGPLVGVPGPKLTRTGKAVLGTNDTLALGYSLACPAAGAAPPCYATVTLTQPVARRGHARAHDSAKRRRAARRARPRVLGRVQVQLAPGRSTALKLRVARRNRAALKAGHITMTTRLSRLGTSTQTVVKPLPVTVATPKPRRRTRRGR
ncbi:MAG TPA: hypothetical protein VGO48_12390 [Conexibacter sp.]|jgi:hypothetical protein|nr:hypothetical protein [Conexibacter sp.]